MAFVDDGSEVPGEPIAMEILKDDFHKVKFYRCDDTLEDKMRRNGINGSLMGKFANDAISSSDADYVIILCDDDALYPDYLSNLAKWFKENKNENYVYSHIKQYNPPDEKPIEPLEFRNHRLNKMGRINPYYSIDMSQVAWRRVPYANANILFPYPHTINIDAEIFCQMMREWGMIDFSGFVGQYKAIHYDNLSHRMGMFLGGRKKDVDIYKINTK
jgi:hypothetical protein